MTPRFSIRSDGDPIRMSLTDAVPCRVRIGARDNRHIHLSTSANQVAKWIGLAKPCTAMVQRDGCGIVRDDTPCAQTNPVGVNTFEIIQPKIRIEPAGIVFHKDQLSPTHWAVEPQRVIFGGGTPGGPKECICPGND